MSRFRGSAKGPHRNKFQNISSEMEINNEFGGETGQSDITLIVEDHKIPVSRVVLCIASPVFRAMFEGDFQEKSKSEIPLPGKKYEEIVEFLRCIYPDKTKKVTEKNAYKLLPLAHEYEVKKMQKRCEKVLIQTVRKSHMNNVMELFRHIHMSEMYGLEDLKKICIYLASEHTLAQFKAARQTYHISADSYDTIVELALRRRELDNLDDRSLSLNVTHTTQRNCYHHIDVVNFTAEGKFRFDHTAVSEPLSVLRLLERFRNVQNEADVRSKMIKKIQRLKLGDRCPQKEEFDLLPENIKSALQNT